MFLDILIGGSRREQEGALGKPPEHVFDFTQFFEKMTKIVGWLPHLWDECSSVWKIMDPLPIFVRNLDFIYLYY